MRSQPLAFMSYSHFDDDNDNGYLTKFCKKLSKEVRAHTGKDFPIFQDRKDIKWGENWKERINGSLQSATFLIPIISPNFFESKNCREELKQFVEYEKDSNRNDLILPIYYISCSQIENIDPEDNKLAETIRASQWRDWRNLRNKSFNQSRVKGELANLAIEIRDSISYPQKTTFENPYPLTATINNGEKEKSDNKLGPRTLIVDKNQSCHYTKINDAINDANPGDRILIYPGIYQEGLILSQSLEIIGEGALGSIVVQAAGQSVLLFKTNRGHIANLVLEQTGGGNWFCIDIAQGSLELEGCDVTSQGSSCVAIHDNARPLLKHNRIHHSKQSGILVFDNGRGILEDNEIFENNFAGIEIRNFGNPILRHNIIRNGKQNGILVYDNGRGTFEDNDIFENEFPQIGILLYGNPFFSNNRVYNGKQNGIFVFAKGLGLFENNDIFGNEYPQVATKSIGNPLFRHNFIYNGKQNGIFVYDDGLGMFEDNDVFSNEYPGVAIKTGSTPILRHNRIYNNKQNGIFVFDNGQGIYEDNDIFGNGYPEFAIGANSNPILRYNKIHNGKGHGVLVLEHGKGLLENNDLFSNDKMGVSIESGGNPIIRGNRINKNGIFAILVLRGGGGVIEDNDLRDNKLGGLKIVEDSSTTVRCLRNLEVDP